MREFFNRAISIRSLLALPLAAFALATAAIAQETTCHIKGTGTAATGPSVTVATDASAGRTVRSGNAIRVTWEVKSKLDLGCRTPLYLVVSMPERVRFAGEGFLALPPNVEGPFAIPQAKNRMRVFVPLHVGEAVAKGWLDVKVYTAGPFELAWQVVEVPKLVAKPVSKKDYARGKAIVAPGSAGSASVTVAQGKPTIVFQDRFATDTPKKVIVHQAAGYEIHDFGTYFRAIERATGEMITERVGVAPRFSLTGRFVLSFGAPAIGYDENRTEFIVYDLRTGAIALDHRRTGDETSGSGYVSVNSVRWGLGDAYLSISHNREAGITLRSMLVERAAKTNAWGPNCCSAIDRTDHYVDLEQATTIYHYNQNEGTDWVTDSLLFSDKVWAGIVSPLEQKELDTLTPELMRLTAANQALDDKHSAAYEAAEAGKPEASRREFTSRPKTEDDRRQTQLSARKDELEKLTEEQTKQAIARTHTLTKRGESPIIDLRPLEKWDEGGRVAAATSAILPEAIKASTPTPEGVVQGRRQRANLTARSAGTVEAASADLLSQRLLEWGLVVKRGLEVKAKDHNPTAASREKSDYRWLFDALAKPMPAARRLFYGGVVGEDGDTRGCQIEAASQGKLNNGGAPDTFLPTGFADKVVSAAVVYTAKDLQPTGRPLWLLATECRMSTGDDRLGQLILLRGAGGANAGDPKLDWLSLAKFNGVEIGNLLGIYDGRNLLAQILHDYFLAISAEGKPFIALFDIRTGALIHVFQSPAQNDAVQRILLTDDQRHLIQLEKDGGLQIYSMQQKKHLASGRYIDDEIVFFDSRGYYDGTPEGAHQVYVKFGGVPGKHSFFQYRRELNRPGLFKTLLAGGKLDARDPQLPPAPIVEFTARKARTSDGPVNVALAVKASAELGLKALRVYVDGQLARTEPLAGLNQAPNFALDVAPTARWVTLEAEDTKGFESVPVTVALPLAPAAKPSGTLYAIAVGTNVYDDLNFKTLNFAETDANTFRDVAKASEGRTYRSVVAETLIDDDNLKAKLIARLEELAKKATAGDTIMLFVAGHGKLDAKTRRFYLLTTTSRQKDLAGTAIDSEAIAKAVGETKARVVLFLDACNSGSADGLGTNEDAAAAFLDRKTAMTIIAASKGRQTAKEGGTIAGGFFTQALKTAVVEGRTASDTNRNGAIELSELYGAVKRRVGELSNGTQTPWIARNNMVGEIPLF